MMLESDSSGVFWFFPIMQFHLNHSGVSCTMKETKHYYILILYHEINGIRESPQQTAPEFVVNLRVKKWVPLNLTGAGIKHPEEILTESRGLRFIPNIAAHNI